MHRKIGILGGMSPESTVTYYEYITRRYTERYGDYGYPEILVYSVNFPKYVEWQREGRWDEAAVDMAAALERLRAAGADFGLIATNTMHVVFDEVQQRVGMPLLRYRRLRPIFPATTSRSPSPSMSPSATERVSCESEVISLPLTPLNGSEVPLLRYS